jgi:cell division protein ZipA
LVELRWILLAIGLTAIGLIWWWSARKSAQAPGNAELRESTSAPVHTFGSIADGPLLRDRSVSPLQPLSIRAADLDGAPELDEPLLAHAEPLDLPLEQADAPAPASRASAAKAAPGLAARSAEPRAAPRGSEPPEAVEAPIDHAQGPIVAPPPIEPVSAAPLPTSPLTGPSIPAASSAAPKPKPATEPRERPAAAPAANTSQTQRIVAVRVCAVGDARWPGSALMSLFEGHGLVHGRYQVYHRKHSDGRSIFCVASLVEPGAFDVVRMPEEEYRGITLFAVLPGPLEPLQALDAMLATARDLAQSLTGMLQDDHGVPFSPQRAASMREDLVRFQARLHAAASS